MTDAWDVVQLLEATEGRLLCGESKTPVAGVSIDSRTLKSGEVFVAIEGERFDGHRYLDQAHANGASCAIVARIPDKAPKNWPLILVEDTTEALGRLGRYNRRRQTATVIAITGSCGKTTTKDLLAQIIDEPNLVLKSAGNHNNHIGVPLTLLRLKARHRFAIVEVATNHPGEIAYLASLVEPDAAVITNVGPAHLEFLGSIMGVMREKLSLLEALKPQAAAFLPGDQLEVCLEAPEYLDESNRIIRFGFNDGCEVRAVDIQNDVTGSLRLQIEDAVGVWRIPLPGTHNAENALAAIAVARYFGVPDSVIRERLPGLALTSLRSEIIEAGSMTIINDCYNANPLSCARALEVLGTFARQRKVAVLGDMLELGSYSVSAHQSIGRMAVKLGITKVIAIGHYANFTAQGVRESGAGKVEVFETVEDAIKQADELFFADDVVLIKGSRSMRLERMTEVLSQKKMMQAKMLAGCGQE